MKILIHGFYGAGNVGDDAILQAIVNDLLQTNERANITVTVRSKKFKAYEGKHPVRTVYGFDLQAVYGEICRSQAVIIGGGGLFQDYNGYDPLDLFKGARGAINYYIAPLMMAKAVGIPVMLYAVGVGPLRAKTAMLVTTNAISLADVVTVRDQESWQQLHALGVQHVKLTADPVINLPFHRQRNTEQWLRVKLKGDDQRPLVGVNLRRWSFDQKSTAQAFEHVKKLCDYLISEYNARICIFPFNQSHEERKLAELLRIKVQQSQKQATIFTVPGDFSVQQIQTICARLTTMVHMRLHAAIMCAAVNTPTIGISYDGKVRKWYEELNLANMCVQLADVDFTRLKQMVDQTMTNHEIWQQRFRKSISTLRTRERGNVNELSKLLAIHQQREGRK